MHLRFHAKNFIWFLVINKVCNVCISDLFIQGVFGIIALFTKIFDGIIDVLGHLGSHDGHQHNTSAGLCN